MCLFPKADLVARRQEAGHVHGFEYEIVANRIGFRCGYIKVLPGHPWFGKGYNDIDAEVHGGLTYASEGTACPGDHDEKAEWWVGFDCGHGGDAMDPTLMPPGRELDTEWWNGQSDKYGYTVKTTEYVRTECASLANQAQAAAA
jgi:hypothetical protein